MVERQTLSRKNRIQIPRCARSFLIHRIFYITLMKTNISKIPICNLTTSQLFYEDFEFGMEEDVFNFVIVIYFVYKDITN